MESYRKSHNKEKKEDCSGVVCFLKIKKM